MGAYVSFSFLWACLLLTVPFALLRALCRAAKPAISARAAYRIGNAGLLLFLLPFLPCPGFLSQGASAGLPGAARRLAQAADSAPAGAAPGAAWAEDTVQAAGGSFLYCLDAALFFVWAAGALLTLCCVLYSCRKLHALNRLCVPVTDPRVLAAFSEALAQSGCRGSVRLYSCPRAVSPLTYGVFSPKLLLPDGFARRASAEQLRLVFLHELQHLCQKDHLLNPCLIAARLVYWFHPCIHLLLRSQRAERELACDEAVIRRLSREEQLEYARTLLLFAKSPAFSSPLAFGIQGKKSVLKERVLCISDYTPGGARQSLLGALALLLAFSLCAAAFPAVSVNAAFASKDTAADTVSEYDSLDLSSYFDGMEGSFVLYDCSSQTWQIYNKKLAEQRVSPDSVYKVCIALNALENGIITPESSSLSWDGTEYPLDAWNQDQTLLSAMQGSVNWYFSELDRQLGEERISEALSDYQYGNTDLSAGVSSYWMESSLKISPEEQTRFFKDFCEGTLPVSRETLEAVTASLHISSAGSSSLYGKTGTGNRGGENVNGWFSGFVKTSGTTWCFALNLQGSGADGARAAEIAQEVLRDMSILNE